MKQATRLVPAALALALSCSWAFSAHACDESKAQTSAYKASKKAKTTAVTAVAASSAKSHAGCTAEQMAACKAKGASATTASVDGHEGCTAEQIAACKSAKGTSATTAVASGKSKKVFFAGAGGSCASKGSSSTSAMTAGAGGSCSGHGMAKAAGKNFHARAGDCDACADMALCGDELTAANAQTQVVPLRNGVMFVYTADSPGEVNAVQSAMARRSERMTQFVNASESTKLCAECRSMRSAMASGKLAREVVNIEGGSLTLMTSEDPTIVAKIHTMVESKTNARVKS